MFRFSIYLLINLSIKLFIKEIYLLILIDKISRSSKNGYVVKKKVITNIILLALEKIVDGYVAFEDFAYNPLLVGRDLKKSDLARALKRLRENGFVELIDDEKMAFRLTDSGRDRALWLKMKESDQKWDGMWRFVIWDVPEKRRIARDLLRYKLKQLGFQRFQKSVWACKKNCTKELRDFIRKTGIEDWVMVIESNNIN